MNTYRIIDTRVEKTVLAVHDTARPYAVIAISDKTGHVMRVWRYTDRSSAARKLRQRVAYQENTRGPS